MTIGKPGICIPLDLAMPLLKLPDAAAGGLLKQLLTYGKYGVSDAVPDEALPLWMVLSSYIQLQDDVYCCGSYRQRYQQYVRWMKKNGRTPVLDYADWMDVYGKDDQEDPAGI